jgi:hypothetical protein
MDKIALSQNLLIRAAIKADLRANAAKPMSTEWVKRKAQSQIFSNKAALGRGAMPFATDREFQENFVKNEYDRERLKKLKNIGLAAAAIGGTTLAGIAAHTIYKNKTKEKRSFYEHV